MQDRSLATTATSPPPGFYEDDSGRQRWWDGSGWGEQRLASPPDSALTGTSITSKVLTVIFPLPALFIGLLMGAFGHRHAWRVCRLALIVIAIEVVLGFAIGIASSPTQAEIRNVPGYCVGDVRGKCLVRPRRLLTGAHTYVRAIHWHSWGGLRALGFGRLIETGGCCEPSFNLRARIRLSLAGECGKRIWYFRLSINYGPHFGRRYLHNTETVPCG